MVKTHSAAVVRFAVSLLAISSAAFWTSAAFSNGFDATSIVALSRAKLGDEALIAQIETQPCNYDLSARGLARFKKDGVSNAVIAALIRHCAAQNSPGIGKAEQRSDVVMLHNAQGWLLTLTPATIAAGHAGGNGSLLFPTRSKLTLPGEASGSLAGSAKPYFIVQPKASSIGNQGFTAQPASVETVAARYRLARFDIGQGKRSLKVDSTNPLGGVTGLDPNDSIPLRAVPHIDSTFRLEIDRELVPGEYALIDVSQGPSYQVYDFSVRQSFSVSH